MTNTSRYFFITALLIVLASCERQATSDDDIVLAVVDDRVLFLTDLKNSISPELYIKDSLKVIEQYRSNWITRQLKAREAQRLGLDRNPEVRRRVQKAEETILADAYNEAVALDISGDPVNRAEAQSFYENNKDKFLLAERHVRYRHMMASTLNDAQNARNALQRGQTWREVVEQYAVNPQQAYRISQQYWPISSAARELNVLNNFLQNIGISEISPVQRIGDHFHFVQLMESRDAGEHPQMEWVIDQITEWLILDKKRKHLQSMEQNLFLRAQANNELRIYDVRVPEQEIEIISDSL